MTNEIASTLVESSRPNGTTIALLTRDAAAAYLAVSTRTLDRLVHAGAITAYRIGGHRRFRIEDIDSFIASKAE
ncbi:MAG: helix-turn-helix domain-containing protein [Steroidobacteraceae bacterium]